MSASVRASSDSLTTIADEEYVALLEAEIKNNETIILKLQNLISKMLAYILSFFKKVPKNPLSAANSLRRKKTEKKKLKIFIGTWNMHGKLPPYSLAPFIENVDDKTFKHDIQDSPYLPRKAQHPYHILVIGTQECQHNIKHSVLFPSKEEWESRLIEYLGDTYVLIKTETMAALHLAVFVWKECKDYVQGYQHDSVATGLANLFGNKGGVGISLLFGNTSLCFINSHLAAHQSKVKQRNHDVKKISKELKLKGFKLEDKALPNVTDRFDYTFWFGDMNYRIDLTREEVDKLINKKQLKTLLCYDQLRKELSNFCYFSNFNEHDITFNPTFKFDITHRTNNNNHENSPSSRSSSSSEIVGSIPWRYDSGPKQRVPSWTDRIIFKTRLSSKLVKKIDVEKYTSHMDVVGFSDHRPVTGCFLVDFDWKSEKELLEKRLSLDLEQDRSDNASISSDSSNMIRGIGGNKKKGPRKTFWKVLKKS
ncbi:DNase I-like protein [Gigaspora margarita]|uniref:DNase I-like protein n=1 Tax=Gigaspora margarita TaxID=4874 RepID=A0A8H3WYJ7_GIGMA|nr:DNase I-like protein [Gigaspora margarita]